MKTTGHVLLGTSCYMQQLLDATEGGQPPEGKARSLIPTSLKMLQWRLESLETFPQTRIRMWPLCCHSKLVASTRRQLDSLLPCHTLLTQLGPWMMKSSQGKKAKTWELLVRKSAPQLPFFTCSTFITLPTSWPTSPNAPERTVYDTREFTLHYLCWSIFACVFCGWGSGVLSARLERSKGREESIVKPFSQTWGLQETGLFLPTTTKNISTNKKDIWFWN